MQMADSNSSTIAPVGVAWKNMRDSFPSVNLYAGDGSHPSLHGSYLAACVFYSTLYQKSTIGAGYVPAGITTIDAFNIQTIATNTVLDSLNLWRINANHPTANFTFNGGGTINFTNTSTNDVYYSWDFGDGNTSTLENPSNTYTSNNTYQVQLIVYSSDSCFTDTITKQITITASGISNVNNTIETSIYPNPANSKITIQTNSNYESGAIINSIGEVVLEFSDEKIIDIHNLNNGVYIIKLFHTETETINLKFVKD
jgi:PKD repeat protein